MPRKRTKAAKQAHTLLVWLETLGLPARVINALRRDLEVVTGEREGEEGSGILVGFNQAQFTEELYQKRGGQVGKVPSVAASAIEALRAAIPAPAGGDTIEATQPAQGDAASEDAAATQSAQGNELPADAALKGAEAVQGDKPEAKSAEVTQEAVPEVTDTAPADAPNEQPADAAPENAIEPVDAPAAPKRRGRPPRAAIAVVAPVEATDAPEDPAKRRERPPRDNAATGLPPRTRRARVAAASAAQQAAPPAEVSTPAPVTPVVPAVVDPLFAVLLRLWGELHPQGQRAAMHYMSDLVGDQ